MKALVNGVSTVSLLVLMLLPELTSLALQWMHQHMRGLAVLEVQVSAVSPGFLLLVLQAWPF
jgi:hypothetical protein